MKMHANYANALSARVKEIKDRGYSSEKSRINFKPHDFVFSAFFDASDLHAFYVGGLPHTIELFEIFRSAFPKKWEELTRGIRQKDCDQVYHAAHNLKPLFRMIGICRFNGFLNTLTERTNSINQDKEMAFQSIESRLPQIMYMTAVEVARMKNYMSATAQ
jgi:hypothetical protein